jgi:FkbM family methyltransferase
LKRLAPQSAVKRVSEFLTKRYFFNLITDAYRNSDGPSHLSIARHAAEHYGLCESKIPLHLPWYMDFLLQAHIDLSRRSNATRFQGMTDIGFDNVKIEWFSSDANSSIVYLFGFSDNRTLFDVYRKFIMPGTCAIDVGANIGIHSLVMASCAGPTGCVLSFEPSDRIHPRLCANLKLNSVQNAIALKMGAGEATDKVRFDMKENDFNVGKGAVSARGEYEIDVTTVDIQTAGCPLPVSLIKIDTEGYELHVLKGAREMLAKHQPVVVCEFNPKEYGMSELVSNIPFDARCFRIPNTYYEKAEPVGSDFSGSGDVLIMPISKNSLFQ